MGGKIGPAGFRFGIFGLGIAGVQLFQLAAARIQMLLPDGLFAAVGSGAGQQRRAPVITSGPLAHRGSFDCLLGDNSDNQVALDAVSIERHIDAKTPPVFVWHTITDDCVPVENTLMLVDACKKAGVPVEAHLFPQGGHGLALGTAETAWQGVNGIEPCVQQWPVLANAWLRRLFA